MCGIAAAFRCPDATRTVKDSLQKIAHRGGNVFEYQSFANAALGANRLPIVGRMTGRQPLANEDKTIFATQNGEIFNHKEIRAELQACGHEFSTDCDTEILVHAYEEYGKNMVKHLDSEMFAFVVYNSRTEDVYAARDPLGVKPFYYAISPSGEWHFASELKQLTQLSHLTEIREFPAGHYFFNGKLTRYFSLKLTKKTLPETVAISRLEKEITEAVRKRVDTDLPIGVFLSGGVDSSLIMEIAVRLHSDVTALILGTADSSDYQFALRLCQERGYKYHVIRPHIDYAQELDELLYYLETYEPLVIRQSFANWICSREAQRLGLSVVLVGEGADELFAGYNEFSALPEDSINEGCRILTENLCHGHLKRVDRSAMRFTVEVRSPFLDTAIVKTAMAIAGQDKIRRSQHRIVTKYILRRTAARFLPDYIAWRYKMPFANGAGMNVGYSYESQSGEIARLFSKSDLNVSENLTALFQISTPEEKYYVQKYCEFGFHKLAGSEKRAVVKDNLHTLNPAQKHRLVVAEFDKLALYFPLYLAAATKKFSLRNLDVDFISTGNDDSTYASLCNNSAQIGLADPLFAMFDNPANEEEKGQIIGQMVQSVPVVAVSINPSIRSTSINNLKKYRLGTFPKFTTTHTVLSNLLGRDDFLTFEYGDVISALESRKIDVAIVLAEQALALEKRGGHIVCDFSDQLPQYFFSGFTVSSQIAERHKKHLPAFTAAVREAMSWMKHHKGRALNIFRELFPEIQDPENVIQFYEKFWVSNLKVKHDDYLKAHQTWKSLYPDMLKSHTPFFRGSSAADSVLDIVASRRFRREYPFLEDILRHQIEERQPIHLVGFWGASGKTAADRHDFATIAHFKELIGALNAAYAPGFQATFILADKHAENNGYSPSSYVPYLQQVSAHLQQNALSFIYLSKLWAKWGITPDDVKRNLKNRPPNWWNKISINRNLEEKSANNFNGEDKIGGAQRYYAMRDIEKPLLEKEYAGCAFFVYGDSIAQQIYPHLPSLYLWSEKPSFSPCPWFLTD